MRTVALLTLALTAVDAAPLAHRSAQREGGMLRATPESTGMSGERLQAATALLRQFVADRRIAGAVAAVARRGKIVYLEPVGLQRVESKTPMTEASLAGAGVAAIRDQHRARAADGKSRHALSLQ